MKNSIYIVLFFSYLLFGCEKSNPEIAGTDELNVLSYSEKIFAQPVQADDQIITLTNTGGYTFLKAFNENGDTVWTNNVSRHIITGEEFSTIDYLKTILSQNDDIMLNMLNDEEHYKSVRFSSSGNLISEIDDFTHQTDTLFIGNDTIDIQGNSKFVAIGFVTLSGGTTAVISSWSTGAVDTTFVQLSRYDQNGYFIGNRYYVLSETVDINNVYISSSNSLILETNSSLTGETKLYIVNTLSNIVYVSPVLPIFDLLSFYENSNGHFILTASTFNSSTDYLGRVITLDNQGNYLWQKTFQNNSAWLFMSVTELPDGYIFTGFDTKNILIDKP